MPKARRQRRTAAEIQEILNGFEDSGLSRRQFSHRREILLSTLQNWQRQRIRAPTTDLPALIPCGTVAELAATIEIELAGGTILRLGPGFRGEDLQAALVELRRC